MAGVCVLEARHAGGGGREGRWVLELRGYLEFRGKKGFFFVRKGVGLFYNFLSIFWNTVER